MEVVLFTYLVLLLVSLIEVDAEVIPDTHNQLSDIQDDQADCIGGVVIGGQCLTFSADKLSWYDAKEICSSQLKTLASLDDPQAFLEYAAKTYYDRGGCKFPFIFKGISYSTCSNPDSSSGGPWCSTETDENDNHVKHHYKYCNDHDGETFFWLGGTDSTNKGKWVWLDGRPFGPQFPWPKDESAPNNAGGNQDCLSWGWNLNYDDVSCDVKLRFVCAQVKGLTSVDNFVSTYNKTYANEEEGKKRMLIFQENYLAMNEHNKLYDSGKSTFRMGVNEYFDLTYEEVISTLTGYQEPDSNQELTRQDRYYSPKDIGKEPEYLDYREKGALNPIRNQGRCGSCWAFTAISNIESQYFYKSGELLQMSEQDLVDCDSGNGGCNGGNMHRAFSYVKEEGIAYRSKYEYTAKHGTCKASHKIFPIEGYKTIRRHNESELLSALYFEGPISVFLFVTDNFHKYKDGVLVDDHCTDSVNHAMLLVGYGTEKGQDYWLLRNSWGESFGEKGYIKMARNVENDCGISKWAVFPIIKVCEDKISECSTLKEICDTECALNLCQKTCELCPKAEPGCKFPFIFKGVSYSTCSNPDSKSGGLWCSTETDENDNHVTNQWKYCPPLCKFPFIFEGVSYSTCSNPDSDSVGLWCSTQTDENDNHVTGHYKYCNGI